jgi:hypothetical protein
MERRFSVEAKAFYFSVKADASEIHLEDKGKGFSGFIFLGLQCSAWLLATVEEALKEPVKNDFVKSFREDVKALMVCGGGNKAARYLEVAIFVEGGCKGVIWLPEGREGWGWSRVVVSCGRCYFFKGSVSSFLGVHIGGDTEGVFFVQSSGWGGFSMLGGSGSGESCFSC